MNSFHIAKKKRKYNSYNEKNGGKIGVLLYLTSDQMIDVFIVFNVSSSSVCLSCVTLFIYYSL